jgi:hypothetical protein
MKQADRLLRRGIRLELATLGWNVVGIVVVFAAAIRAGSVALAGFGIDTAIEIVASTVVVWHLREVNAERERPAMLVLSVAFAGLAVYVTAQAGYALVSSDRPEPLDARDRLDRGDLRRHGHPRPGEGAHRPGARQPRPPDREPRHPDRGLPRQRRARRPRLELGPRLVAGRPSGGPGRRLLRSARVA